MLDSLTFKHRPDILDCIANLTLGPTPRLILPPTLKLADADHFHLEALNEPAKTGFLRFIAQGPTSAAANDPLPKAASYVHFLMEG